MKRILSIVASLSLVAACNVRETNENEAGAAETPGAASSQTVQQASGPREKVIGDNGLELQLPSGVSKEMMADRDIEILAVQVLLDHTRHSPGVIDGYPGENVVRAIREYRKMANLPQSDAVDGELLRSLLESQGGRIFATYTLTERDLRYPYRETPEDYADMAEMDRVTYQSALEMLAERFHMDQDFLAALNPAADFTRVGTRISIVSQGDDRLAGEIARIEVRKDSNSVVVLDDADTVLASYPASIGSDDFPSPSGTMRVQNYAPQANYTFDNEEQEWGPEESYVIAAGPNNPVGGIWIDLSKKGYGIHGSPDPQLIGKTVSHGCVRLTNWDARELGEAVSQGVEVVFL